MGLTPRTGEVLETKVLPALRRGGYNCQVHVRIGKYLRGATQKVHAVAEKDSQRTLVSMKWRQRRGTGEQKVPFEVIRLADAVCTGKFKKAYLVLGGTGWSLRDYYLSSAFRRHFLQASKVNLMTLEAFAALAINGKL